VSRDSNIFLLVSNLDLKTFNNVLFQVQVSFKTPGWGHELIRKYRVSKCIDSYPRHPGKHLQKPR